MSEQVKGALVIAAGLVVAACVYSWTTTYFSPFETCLRSSKASAEESLSRWLVEVPSIESQISTHPGLEVPDYDPTGTILSALRSRLADLNGRIDRIRNRPASLHENQVEECSALNSR
jgi:hypothetical protein